MVLCDLKVKKILIGYLESKTSQVPSSIGLIVLIHFVFLQKLANDANSIVTSTAAPKVISFRIEKVLKDRKKLFLATM
jgi:hypothetical protein